MNNLQIFNNPEFGQVRTIQIDGEPWFVGKDVATALGYENPSKALSDHVDSEDKLNNESLSSLGQRGGWLINESGLYSLIFSSKLPGAKEFKRWVTSEVLPAIRKTGAYSVPTRPIPLIAKRTVAKVRETREMMEALGENPIKILKTLKEICNRAGYNPPALVIDPYAITMADVDDMIDFVYAHKGESTTYDDYLAYRLLPKLES